VEKARRKETSRSGIGANTAIFSLARANSRFATFAHAKGKKNVFVLSPPWRNSRPNQNRSVEKTKDPGPWDLPPPSGFRPDCLRSRFPTFAHAKKNVLSAAPGETHPSQPEPFSVEKKTKPPGSLG